MLVMKVECHVIKWCHPT